MTRAGSFKSHLLHHNYLLMTFSLVGIHPTLVDIGDILHHGSDELLLMGSGGNVAQGNDAHGRAAYVSHDESSYLLFLHPRGGCLDGIVRLAGDWMPAHYVSDQDFPRVTT